MPGANAVIPRTPSLEEILTRYSRRLRRLEVNHRFPVAGTALYGTTFSLSPAATWTPDFTAATATQVDQVGLTIDTSGVDIPPGWIAWVTVALALSCSDPPTGEALLWSIAVGEGVGVSRSDVMVSGAYTYAATVVAPAGWAASDLPVLVGSVASEMGTEFTPESMGVNVAAIQLPTLGWPVGDDE